jgi:hypothetical protein
MVSKAIPTNTATFRICEAAPSQSSRRQKKENFNPLLTKYALKRVCTA